MLIKKIIFIILGSLFLSFSIFSQDIYNLEYISDSYNELELNGKVSFAAFLNAIAGMKQIKNTNTNILTIVDFTKPSTEERMYVLDLEEKKILLSTHVSHGRGTGGLYAQKFSNRDGSYQSSPGFFLTGNIYNGINGDSLELYGLEKGINDNAKKRNIVIHGADYANPKFIVKNGRLGRSKGCLAVPFSINKELIDTIAGGTVCYVHIEKYNNREVINLSQNF